MALEIERKFLVCGDGWRDSATPENFRQGYLAHDATHIVRVRIEGRQAYITIKGMPRGIVRPEYEYPIPLKDAQEILGLLPPRHEVVKRRSKVLYAGKLWEIDEFLGDNAGLIVAEIELNTEHETFEKPDWVGEEISEDSRYYNVSLMLNPYCNWKND